jgi:hypothetical protein
MKPISLSAHARENLSYRGTTEQEIIDTIRLGQPHGGLPNRDGWNVEKTFSINRIGTADFTTQNKYDLSLSKKQKRLWL